MATHVAVARPGDAARQAGASSLGAERAHGQLELHRHRLRVELGGRVACLRKRLPTASPHAPPQAVYSRDNSPNVLTGPSHLLSECVNNFQAGLEEISFTSSNGGAGRCQRRRVVYCDPLSC